MSVLRTLSIVVILFFCAVLGCMYALTANHWIDFTVLEQYNCGKPSIVLDDQGAELARFQLDRREPIPLNAMPQHVINAFIAAEDWNFFSHQGVSFKGMVRSLLVNVYHGHAKQGASTITQQLVRLLFLNSRKTIGRKLKEQLYAILVEQQFTKEQILELYLNNVYFGCGIYGVQAACHRFWNKDIAAISIGQAATLAAIMRSPAQYCPLLCPLSSEQRRNVVLSQMRKLHFVTQEEYESERALSLTLSCPQEQHLALHAKESIRQSLEELVGKEQLYTGGFIIQTTLNKNMQYVAEKEFISQCKKLRKELSKDLDGALISIEGSTGEIKALVGGVDFISSSFNRATQARRQAGSVIKPLVYATAIAQGMTFADTEIDEPMEIMQDGALWAPRNYNHKFNGQMTLAYALAHSNNIVTIKTLLKVGAPAVAALVTACGVRGQVHTYPSLALGCVDITLKEAVGMFNIFAHNGNYTEPHLIRWVKDQWGKKIYKAECTPNRVLDSRVADQVSKALTLGIARLQKIYASEQWLDCQAMCKTGTTNDFRTCWFVGATPTYTTAVYIGCDDNRSMGTNFFPVRNAFPIWLSFNKQIPAPTKQFIFNPTLRPILVNERTGEQVDQLTEGIIELLV